MLAHKVHVPLVALVLASLVLLSLGALVGTKLSWGTKNPRTVDGVAVLHNPANSLGGFQADDGGVTAAFDAKTVSWVKGEEHGEGDKPCLTPGEGVSVEAGVIWVSEPNGGAHPEVAWIRCR